jgi:hypothetical protein
MEELPGYDFEAVIIIGNGFDLSLGLKTSYNDFVESNYFESLLKADNSLAKYLNARQSLHNWIDIENELKKYSKGQSNNDRFLEDFKGVSSALKEFLNKVNLSEFDREQPAIKTFQSIKDMPTLIIDFNYTDTVSKISDFLDLKIADEDSHFHHLKIHGTLENDDLIFGVEDKADIIPKHIFLKKSVNKSFQPIDFSKEILNSSNFIIFGHSLGETDHMYFEDYFKHASLPSETRGYQNIVIYHYGEESYYDLFAQLDKLTQKKITKLKQLNNLVFTNTKKQQ